jgi:hypothetical protein
MASEERATERKFKVGDTVQVLTPKDQEEYRLWQWSSEDEALQGRYFTIMAVTTYRDEKWPYKLDLGEPSKNRWEPEACLKKVSRWQLKRHNRGSNAVNEDAKP